MLGTAAPTHLLAFPPKTWAELCRLERGLQVVDDLAPLLDLEHDYPLTYIALRDVASGLVGWSRGRAANRLCGCSDPEGSGGFGHGTFVGLAGLTAMERESMPAPNEIEAWLRTSEAYDLALGHVIELTK